MYEYDFICGTHCGTHFETPQGSVSAQSISTAVALDQAEPKTTILAENKAFGSVAETATLSGYTASTGVDLGIACGDYVL